MRALVIPRPVTGFSTWKPLFDHRLAGWRTDGAGDGNALRNAKVEPAPANARVCSDVCGLSPDRLEEMTRRQGIITAR
jgi:hypothetical protein